LNNINLKWTLLYDETCSLCKKYTEIIEIYDRNHKVSLKSLQKFYKKNQNIPLSDLMKDIHLLNNKGIILKGEDAIQKLISIIPASKPFKWMIESNTFKKSASSIYRAGKKFRKCREC
jgi:predicted DCC family thiol-disulfide oxidoreductase YuxK